MNARIKLGVIMDPIESINPKKDSTLAMLLAAQARGWQVHYFLQKDLFLRDGTAFGDAQGITVTNDLHDWFSYTGDRNEIPLHELDVILMRVDPPYNLEYIYTTHILQRAEDMGALVVNRPASLRQFNEKLGISRFPAFCTPTLVTADKQRVRTFLQEHQDIVVKPLDGMGGQSVFRIRPGDANTGVILETITRNGLSTIMAQRYIPAITEGDKRILLINGEPVPYALARIPAEGENRGNLAAGGKGVGRELTARDREICSVVGPFLKDHGIVFAGLDVIGDYLTEINITSPTCIRELDAIYQLNIADELMSCIEALLNKRH